MTSTQILSNYQAPTRTQAQHYGWMTIYYKDGDIETLGVMAKEIDLTDASFVVVPGHIFTADEFIDGLFNEMEG